MKRRPSKRKFVVTVEMIALTVIISILAIFILNGTKESLQTNFDDSTKIKLQRDLFTNN